MSSALYRQLTSILTKWPLDSTKKGRDLGEFIRKTIADEFPRGESSKVDTVKWSMIANHLEDIANNSALKKYPRKLNSSSTGLSASECREIVSTKFLTYLKQGG